MRATHERTRLAARSRRAWAAGALATLILGAVTPAAAHEIGVITVRPGQIPVGGAVVITGTKLEKSTPVRLELRGALKTFPLGSAAADTAGHFELRVVLPDEAGVGDYTIAAIAPDGDLSAQTDLVIVPRLPADAGGQAAASPEMPGMPGMAGMPHATAEYLSVPSTTTPAGWAVIIAIIVAAFIGGVVLLRPPGTGSR